MLELSPPSQDLRHIASPNTSKLARALLQLLIAATPTSLYHPGYTDHDGTSTHPHSHSQLPDFPIPHLLEELAAVAECKHAATHTVPAVQKTKLAMVAELEEALCLVVSEVGLILVCPKAKDFCPEAIAR